MLWRNSKKKIKSTSLKTLIMKLWLHHICKRTLLSRWYHRWRIVLSCEAGNFWNNSSQTEILKKKFPPGSTSSLCGTHSSFPMKMCEKFSNCFGDIICTCRYIIWKDFLFAHILITMMKFRLHRPPSIKWNLTTGDGN